jgi:hypothetical protein
MNLEIIPLGEAIMLGLIGVLVFRLGFYRDNEWLYIVGGIGIFVATVFFVFSTSRIIISHISILYR